MRSSPPTRLIACGPSSTTTGAEQSPDPVTVEELLREGTGRLRDAGSETPRLDAELLLGEALGVDRTRVVAYGGTAVGDGQVAAYRRFVERRAAGEPVAYIRGLKEFHGLALSVDPRALIPRPETERLVDLAEHEIADRLLRAPRPAGAERLAVVDVGTGSGAVAVALAVALRRRRMLDEVRILATDISSEALELAAENVAGHAVADAVSLRVADLLPSGFEAFEVLLANPPYVRSGAIAGLPVATSFEPTLALDGGPDGLEIIRRLVALLPGRLAFGGVALIEIGADQGEAIGPLVEELLPGWSWRVEPDLGGLPRVVRVERPPG
jgi:release factor glutamine methyltransferase